VFQVGPWWKMDLGYRQAVNGLQIIGSAAAYQIYVGNETESLGLMHGTTGNAICTLAEYGMALPGGSSYPCYNQLYGRYVSIEVVDPIVSQQLILCNVQPF